MYSMTGYGRGIAESEGHRVTTEIKTLNHRFLDLNFQAPKEIYGIEEDLRKIIQQYFSRGRIDVSIHISHEKESPYDIGVDWNLLDQYMEQLKAIKNKYNLQAEIPIDLLSTLPDLFLVKQREDLLDQVKSCIFESLEEAAIHARESRRKEGAYLQKDVVSRIESIQRSVLLLEENQEQVALDYHKRIKERLESYTKDLGEIDYNRMHQEIALLIEKGDITEEITRIQSHIDQCLQLFKQNSEEEPLGRRADFIVQEIHRELNTIGSKAIDEKTGRIIIHSKSELEKVREQIQNIE